MTGQKGFLLLDIAISLTIAALVSILATAWYVRMVDAQTHALHRLEAVMLASSVIEQSRAEDMLALPVIRPGYALDRTDSSGITKGTGWPEKFTVATDRHLVDGIEYFTVRVLWKEKGHQCHVELISSVDLQAGLRVFS